MIDFDFEARFSPPLLDRADRIESASLISMPLVCDGGEFTDSAVSMLESMAVG